MEPPLHPTPMQRPMMKGKIYVDPSNKPTFQGIWGMTHADVTKGGHTNDFKVVRMESVRSEEVGMTVFPGHYLGYFKLTANHQTETVNESFTLQFKGHTNQGYNVYGCGENRFGKTEIVGTVTQTGKMEIFKMLEGTTKQPNPDESASHHSSSANPRPSMPSSGKGGGKPRTVKSSEKNSTSKKKSKSSSKNKSTPSRPSKNGLPGPVVKVLKECVQTLKKSDKGQVFHYPVPPNFRGPKGVYSDVIKKPMDLGTVMAKIDTKYRTAAECIEDLRLVFSNAKAYNPDTDPIHALATSLSGKFESYLSKHRAALSSSSSSPNGSAAAGGSKNQRVERVQPTPNGSSGSSTSAAPVRSRASLSDDPVEKEKKADTDKVKCIKGPGPLTPEEQRKLVEDVNKLFDIWGASPSNERAQAQIFALWCFAKVFVADKDRVMVEGGKRMDIQVEALGQRRQRQLKDVVHFLLEEQKATNEPGKSTNRGASSDKDDAPETKKRYRSDSSGSEDEEGYPSKARRANSTTMGNERAPSSDLGNKVDSAKLEEEDFDFDFGDDDDDEEDEKAKSEVDDGEVDVHWSQAQQEKREREEREKKRAAEQKELEEHRMKIQKQRERERVEEGLRFNRERAAEKARQEAAAREKERLKQKAIEEKMMAQRLIREQQKDTVDLDQVRGNSVLMNLMDASVYDD